MCNYSVAMENKFISSDVRYRSISPTPLQTENYKNVYFIIVTPYLILTEEQLIEVE